MGGGGGSGGTVRLSERGEAGDVRRGHWQVPHARGALRRKLTKTNGPVVCGDAEGRGAGNGKRAGPVTQNEGEGWIGSAVFSSACLRIPAHLRLTKTNGTRACSDPSRQPSGTGEGVGRKSVGARE